MEHVLAALSDNKEPVEFNRDLWLALVQLEKNRGLFRFEDLDEMPPVPADDQAKKAGGQLFAQVLERLIKSDNYKWLPSDKESAKIILWCDQRIDVPTPHVRALKAESLVRSGAKLGPIGQLGLPLQADWYGAYVHALVKHKSASLASNKKEFEEAANLLVSLFKDKPKVEVNPRERRKQSAQILLSALGVLPRNGVDAKEFASDKDASKAIAWLHPVLDLEDAQAKQYFDALVDIAFAAVKTETPNGGEILKNVLDRVNRLAPADKLKGYRWLGKVYQADLNQARAVLKAEAIQRSKRAQDFAFAWLKVDALESAADLNGRAVDIEAKATFEQAKAADRAKAKYDIFATALQRAKDTASKKSLENFVLPVLVAKLESARDFLRKDLETTITDGETAVQSLAPQETWGLEWHSKAMARTADARFLLLVSKLGAQEKVDLKSEYSKMLALYQGAGKSGKYQDRFQGELLYKIGSLNHHLLEHKAAKRDLLAAQKKLAAIPMPYPPEVAEEIRQAVVDVADLLNSKELKNLE
jgi:hypothetical protein